MTTISAQQATTLAELMERNHAHAAEIVETSILGIPVKVAVLSHVDREDDQWQSAHVLGILGSASSSASIGNLPKPTDPRRPDPGRRA